MRRITHPGTVVVLILAASALALLALGQSHSLTRHEWSSLAVDGIVQFISLVLAFFAGVWADRIAERREVARAEAAETAAERRRLASSLTAVRREVADCCDRARDVQAHLGDGSLDYVVFFDSAWRVAQAPITHAGGDGALHRELSTFYRRIDELQWALREHVHMALRGHDEISVSGPLIQTRVARVLQEELALYAALDADLAALAGA